MTNTRSLRSARLDPKIAPSVALGGQDAAYRPTFCRNPRCSSDYAFLPTCNSATLKGTPHPPIPQYPSGFLARYCW